MRPNCRAPRSVSSTSVLPDVYSVALELLESSEERGSIECYMMIICCRLVSIGIETGRSIVRIASLIRVAATLLGCLPSGAVAQRAGAAVSGAATVVQKRMPRVIGLPLAEAVKVVLSRTGLECRARRLQGGNPSPTDSVVRQIPAAEQIPTNTAACVLFVLPHASPQVPLNPNVVGRSIEDAIAILKRAELNPRISTVATTDTALNSVIGQNPSSTAPIRPDRSIDLTLAGVPNVIGLSLADATRALERAHLRRGSASEREAPTGANNAVLDQRPAAGQRAVPLTVVNLVVARVVVPATVPLLIGQQLDRATQMLTDARLVLGRVDSVDSQRPVGIVIGQSRPQQTSVPPGTSIGVTVARAAAFRMPNLVGLTIADARATSAKAGLTIGSLKIANAEGRPDTIVGQTPVAGAAVRSGDTVTLVAGRANRVVATPPVTTPPVTTPPVANPQTPNPTVANPPRSTAPANPASPPQAPPQRETVRTLRLTIVPESISIHFGDTVRMTAIAHMSDGTQSQVAATWTATGGNIAGDGRFIAGKSMSRVVVTASQGGQSGIAVIRVETSRPPWLIALVVAGLAGLGVIGRLVWRSTRPPLPPTPPPLAFTYDYELSPPVTEIATSGGHGPDLALVSYAGDSEYTIEPRGVKLFDEEKSYG